MEESAAIRFTPIHHEGEMKTNRKRAKDTKNWFFFRAGEPAHRVASRSKTQLLTACGLHFHPATATPVSKNRSDPKCRNCIRICAAR